METPEQQETRASIVGYLERVAAEQQYYADQAGADMVYRGRLSMRAFMARALARRIARGEDREVGGGA
jgi:hypothetical protein